MCAEQKVKNKKAEIERNACLEADVEKKKRAEDRSEEKKDTDASPSNAGQRKRKHSNLTAATSPVPHFIETKDVDSEAKLSIDYAGAYKQSTSKHITFPC